MTAVNILIYLLRHDLRVSDNPVFHHLATVKDHGFTHLLPVYVFPAHQIGISGFIRDGSKSPYPEARSDLGGYWRCGPHRARFLAQSVWELKESLQGLNSDLCLRAGSFDDVLQALLKGFSDKQQKVGAVWMTSEEAVEEKRDERAVSRVCSEVGVDFKLWQDEKYFVDDRDIKLGNAQNLPDVFTTYRKSQEPLRERPRLTLPKPDESSLPAYPDQSSVAAQAEPFEMSTTYDDLESCLLKPVESVLNDVPKLPDGAKSVHLLDGGEIQALNRVGHLIRTGAISSYKDTRNGLSGVDFSTKLSAYLALGCLTARQVHKEMVKFKTARRTRSRRDYMRLCTRKFGPKLFRDSGFREGYKGKWKTATKGGLDEVAQTIQRFLSGTTGMGLIDASQRELLHTGYTSNQAPQNVASFLTKHLGIDWRYGAEWYECLLVDYDVSSNWSNWQYVAGVGNDPRGEARIFNPVKQAFDYDKDGEYVKTWVPEVRSLERLENVFQAWTASHDELERHGILDNVMVKEPIKKIDFSVEGMPKAGRRPYMRRRGRGGGNTGGNAGTGSGGGPPQGAPGGPNGHAPNPLHHEAHNRQQRPSDPYGQGQYGMGYRGGFGGYRGQQQYRGYRGRGGGGGPRGGRGSYNTGRWNGSYPPQNPYDNSQYYGTSMNRPHWTTTNPGQG
ncbi:putative cryptochrome DASH like protein [Verticillium longisporum]|uniref:Cryptochrome DASH n=1 Tax=Verticillium longisporum TaxID=100787 RepID=A0A8I2ZHD4_VERLO|nr:putative cryptochrome DASH like protein [Verticillium longisporum]